jgi:hypothetical protein
MEAQEVDGTGTQASEDRLKCRETNHSTTNGEVISSGMLLLLSLHTAVEILAVVKVVSLYSYYPS